MNSIPAKLMLLIGVALCSFQAVSCNNPILTKPACYLGHIKHIVLTKDYETLDSWPRTETCIGSKGLTPVASNPIIEIFKIKDGRTEFRFTLYRRLDAASHEYECERAEYAPVCYEESNQTGVKAFQSCIVRPRADVEGAYTPMDHYTARACVQLRNAVVDIVVNSANPSVPEMEDALKRLSEIVISPGKVTLVPKNSVELAGSGQPATKPADKPPVKVQPPTPTLKDAPR